MNVLPTIKPRINPNIRIALRYLIGTLLMKMMFDPKNGSSRKQILDQNILHSKKNNCENTWL
jgi:hypothetical protein